MNKFKVGDIVTINADSAQNNPTGFNRVKLAMQHFQSFPRLRVVDIDNDRVVIVGIHPDDTGSNYALSVEYLKLWSEFVQERIQMLEYLEKEPTASLGVILSNGIAMPHNHVSLNPLHKYIIIDPEKELIQKEINRKTELITKLKLEIAILEMKKTKTKPLPY